MLTLVAGCSVLRDDTKIDREQRVGSVEREGESESESITELSHVSSFFFPLSSYYNNCFLLKY